MNGNIYLKLTFIHNNNVVNCDHWFIVISSSNSILIQLKESIKDYFLVSSGDLGVIISDENESEIECNPLSIICNLLENAGAENKDVTTNAKLLVLLIHVDTQLP